jgi:hypothetical protein
MTRQPDQKPGGSPSRLGRLKVHLRLLLLAGTTYRVVTLRPAIRVAFSTNYYHDTWHLVGDMDSSQLLARLLWGLSYQRRPDTLVLVHGPHLLPTPFEGERSDPFLLLPAHLTASDPDAFRMLKTRLAHLGLPHGTIRWHTFGLDLALRAWREDVPHSHCEHEWDRLPDWDREGLWR